MQTRSLAFWSRVLLSSEDNYFPKAQSSWPALGLRRNWKLHHGPPSYYAIRAAHHELGIIWPIKAIIWMCTAVLHYALHKWYGPSSTWRQCCMDKWQKYSWPPTQLHCFLVPCPHLCIHLELTMISWQRKKILGIVNRQFQNDKQA